jgi:hypothetical protein
MLKKNISNTITKKLDFFCCWYCIFVLFCSTEVWAEGLKLARQALYHLSYALDPPKLFLNDTTSDGKKNTSGTHPFLIFPHPAGQRFSTPVKRYSKQGLKWVIGITQHPIFKAMTELRENLYLYLTQFNSTKTAFCVLSTQSPDTKLSE